MFRAFLLAMALAVTHTTPADASFSAAGQAAWDATHTVTGLAAVATSGAYGDLTGTPVLAAVATTGAYGSLSGTPTLAAVATTGAYGSLSGTPVLAAVATTGAYGSLSGTPVLAAVATTGAYGSITGTPAGMVQAVYVSGQSTVVAASVSSQIQLMEGTNITITATSSAGGAITFNAAAGSAAAAWPVGSIYMSTRSTTPATILGFGTWTAIEGKFVVGVKAADPEFGAGVTGGSTGTSYTPSGTNSVVQFTPSGTNAISLFREAAAGTNAASAVTGSASVEWPVGVPSAAATTVSASVDWPSSKPTFSGTSHFHELPFFSTGATGFSMVSYASGFGSGQALGGALRVSATASGPIVRGTAGTGNVALSNTATAAGVISWPASVPQAVTSAGHSHVMTWPATAPSAVGKTLTAAAQVFTGVTGSVSGQVFTGTEGTVPAQTFSGNTTNIAILPPYLTVYMWERTA